MWRCKVCNKLGTYKSNMLRHTMTHTGERPHPCKFCQQSFSISSNRHRHEKKCKLNPNPSLEALVPNLLNQFNGHPTGGPGRPPHHRGFPGGAQMALMGPGGLPGFPGGFPALPPPEICNLLPPGHVARSVSLEKILTVLFPSGGSPDLILKRGWHEPEGRDCLLASYWAGFSSGDHVEKGRA